jgi:hypothetical protein
MAITALRQCGDNAAALACRQRKAAEPPGFTPGQCTAKSERQAARMAATCGAEASCLQRPQAPARGERPALPPLRAARRQPPEAEVAPRRQAEAVLQPQALVLASLVQALAPRSQSAVVRQRRAPPCKAAILWPHCA